MTHTYPNLLATPTISVVEGVVKVEANWRQSDVQNWQVAKHPDS